MKTKSPASVAFSNGCRDGVPIGLGYLAVAFSLGIYARNMGLNPFQGFLSSLTTIASAGEAAGFSIMGADAAYWEMILVILVTNCRYFLMSCSLSQHIAPKTSIFHRLGMGMFITDEIFGCSIAQPGYVYPQYMYGAALTSVLPWAFGTMMGIIAGNIFPDYVVAALSVSLYGMFIAIIIPPVKKDKVIGALVAASFLISYFSTKMAFFQSISEGMRIIILTLIISVAVALIAPVKEENHDA